mmetsp:Transcript_20199/g.37340  ORF Transcript_20199/g.37340 Transcript_20199/m.37340 type:complete len:252 (+) Transcript_20199:232-987(+)
MGFGGQQVKPAEAQRRTRGAPCPLQPPDQTAARLGALGRGGDRAEPVQARAEGRPLGVQAERKHLACDLGGDVEDAVVVFRRVHAQGLAEPRPGVVAHVHGRVDRQQEEADPQLVAALQQMGLGPHHQCERLTMPELVMAPALEPSKDRVEALFRVAFELPVDADVAGIADLLGEIGRVEDVFRLEVGVGLGLLELHQVHAQPEVLQRLVDEVGMPRFVPRQIAHQLLDVGVADVLGDLVVEHASGVLTRQ